MIAAKSVPAGSVPYSSPPSPASREAQKASATAGGALRTSSEPCRHSAMLSTTRRARVSSVAGSANWPFSSCTRASSRASPPLACSTSSRNTSSERGERVSARSTSRLMTLPEPSQIEASGASRYRRGIPESST